MRPVVESRLDEADEARAIIRRRALRMGAPLTIVEPAPLLGWDRDGIEVDPTTWEEIVQAAGTFGIAPEVLA